MNLEKILSGESKIIIPFEEYFTHLDGSEMYIDTVSRTLTIMNSKKEKLPAISIGQEAFKKIKKLKLPQVITDVKSLEDYSVLLNGFMRKDWLFVTKDFSNQIIGK